MKASRIDSFAHGELGRVAALGQHLPVEHRLDPGAVRAARVQGVLDRLPRAAGQVDRQRPALAAARAVEADVGGDPVQPGAQRRPALEAGPAPARRGPSSPAPRPRRRRRTRACGSSSRSAPGGARPGGGPAGWPGPLCGGHEVPPGSAGSAHHGGPTEREGSGTGCGPAAPERALAKAASPPLDHDTHTGCCAGQRAGSSVSTCAFLASPWPSPPSSCSPAAAALPAVPPAAPRPRGRRAARRHGVLRLRRLGRRDGQLRLRDGDGQLRSVRRHVGAHGRLPVGRPRHPVRARSEADRGRRRRRPARHRLHRRATPDSSGGVAFGIRTASGGVFSATIRSASPVARSVLFADVTGHGEVIALASDGRQVLLCGGQRVPAHPGAEPAGPAVRLRPRLHRLRHRGRLRGRERRRDDRPRRAEVRARAAGRRHDPAHDRRAQRAAGPQRRDRHRAGHPGDAWPTRRTR